MLKIFFLLLLSLNFATANNEHTTSEIKILDIKGWQLSTSKTKAMKVGQRVFVIKSIKQQYQVIIAKCFIQALSDNAKLKCKPYKDLDQENLYQINAKISKKAKLILEPLQDNILIIAANFEAYQTVKNKQQNKLIIHPDIFVSFLTLKQNSKPSKADFQEFCRQYFVSSILIALPNKVYNINCESFVILDQNELELDQNKQQFPFYNRLDTIETAWYDFFSQKPQDFNSYYRQLIKPRN